MTVTPRLRSSGWSGIFGVGTAAGPRTVIARADSFTGPPRVAMPFNLENDDAESVESVRARSQLGCTSMQHADCSGLCVPAEVGSYLAPIGSWFAMTPIATMLTTLAKNPVLLPTLCSPCIAK